jgi:hypothetical protein
MTTVPVDILMLENSVSPVVWSCDIHYICWNLASVLVTAYIERTLCGKAIILKRTQGPKDIIGKGKLLRKDALLKGHYVESQRYLCQKDTLAKGLNIDRTKNRKGHDL